MRVFITGGNGMLAQSVQQLLQRQGVPFVGVARDACDLTQTGALAKQIDAFQPSAIVNCAAFTKVDVCETTPEVANEVNGHAVGRLAEACRERGIALVHFSTDYVFDGKANRPYRPDDATGPLGVYGRSKLLGEQLIAQSGLADWLVIRTSWLFGADGPGFPKAIVSRARAQQPLTVVADQRGTPTYAPDLAAAALAMLQSGQWGIQHFCNSGPTTWYEFARAILREFGLPGDVTPITSAEWKAMHPATADRPAYGVLESTAPARPWAEALADYRKIVNF